MIVPLACPCLAALLLVAEPLAVDEFVTVAEWVDRLADDSFPVRREATRSLVALGPRITPLVDAAHMGTRDAEVRHRLDRVRLEMWDRRLVLRLPLAGDARDASGRHNDGEASPGGAWNAPGSIPALDTTRDGRSVRVPDDPSLDVDQSFTIAAWIRPTSIEYVRLPSLANAPGEPTYPWGESPAQLHGHFIAAKWQSSGQHGDFILAVTPSGQLGLAVANSAPRFQHDAVRTEARLPTNEWTHVAATFDDGLVNLFVDGRVSVTRRCPAVKRTDAAEYPRDELYVGRLWADGYEFHGAIRELHLFRAALEAGDVQRLRRMTRPPMHSSEDRRP